MTKKEALRDFGKQLPSKDAWQELHDHCKWDWDDTRKGSTVTRPNGNSIFLPADGIRYRADTYDVGSHGYY